MFHFVKCVIMKDTRRYFMEIWSNIIIPIITSILGGLIGGLFTFLGVKLTLKDERKRHEEQVGLNIIEKNKEIIKNRPILRSIENCESSLSIQAMVYLVPFREPELINKKDIIFHYPEKFEEKQNWKEYTIHLKNIGNKRITRSFLHFEDLKNINLYSDLDMYNWNHPLYVQHYFSDALTLSGHIAPGEILELKIYYLKDSPNYKNVLFDIYFEDENGNNWVQYRINRIDNDISAFDIVSGSEYSTYRKKDMSTFFLYNKMFFNDKVKKSFKYNQKEMLEFFDKEMKMWHHMSDEMIKFKNDCKDGKVLLKDSYREF